MKKTTWLPVKATTLLLAVGVAVGVVAGCSAGSSVMTPPNGSTGGAGGGGNGGFAGGNGSAGSGATGGRGDVANTGGAGAAPVGTGGSANGTGGGTASGGTTMGTGGSGSGGGPGGSGSGGTAVGSGSGVLVGAMCFARCAGATTDPDGDGYGFEGGRSCLVSGSPPTVGAPACAPAPVDAGIPSGDGFFIQGACHPPCASAATDLDPLTGMMDGWGYEMGRSCIVKGSAPALQGIACVPAGAATGDGYQVGTACSPACRYPAYATPQGFGYEAQQTCVVAASAAALQSGRCMLLPRMLPPPGGGSLLGETCFPACGVNAQTITPEGYGWDVNRTCVVAASMAAIQGIPCVPPAADVTGECPRTLTCPAGNGRILQCGCTWVDQLAERKQQILGMTGASQYFVAAAMMETATLRADYTLGDGKSNDAFNAGIAKQNWGMMRRCHPAWNSQTESQFSTSTALNTNLALDIQVFNECRGMFGANWWSGHRNGFNNLGSNTPDIQNFKTAMDWTNQMLTTHLSDDVRFWVTIPPI